jgi:hypothetical protein
MKTANDFAQFAVELGRMAQTAKPEDSEPYGQTRKLIQFHLQSAAAKTREIAEALARTENRK